MKLSLDRLNKLINKVTSMEYVYTLTSFDGYIEGR